MSYPTLKKIATENGTFAGELLRENCDFIGYMFFDSINQTFEPCLARICDILYLYLTKIHPLSAKIRCRSQNLPALRERPLPRWSARFRILKKEGILDTSRKQIEILDEEKLLAHCTLGMRSNII